MLDLKKLQKEIYALKKKRGFNITDISMEFCLIYEELAEAFDAYHRKRGTLGEEMADVMIYLLGLAEIMGIDLEKELIAKNEKNHKREYKKINGVHIRTKEA